MRYWEDGLFELTRFYFQSLIIIYIYHLLNSPFSPLRPLCLCGFLKTANLTINKI